MNRTLSGSARALVVGALSLLVSSMAVAADHGDSPSVSADNPADLSDFFAWHTADGKIIGIIAFAQLELGISDPVYDRDVLYGIHVDTDGNVATAEHNIWVRFGSDGEGNWGVQVKGLPGTTGDLVGPAGGVVTDADSGLRVATGVFDDPFFADLQGLGDTLASGTLSFDAGRDFFQGRNVNAIVLEMDTGATTGAAHTVNMWATTYRIGG